MKGRLEVFRIRVVSDGSAVWKIWNTIWWTSTLDPVDSDGAIKRSAWATVGQLGWETWTFGAPVGESYRDLVSSLFPSEPDPPRFHCTGLVVSTKHP